MRCEDNLAFHHLSGKKFSLTIKVFQRSSKSLLPEVRKCVIACHNCHGEIHRGLITIDRVVGKHKEFQSLLDAKTDEFLSL